MCPPESAGTACVHHTSGDDRSPTINADTLHRGYVTWAQVLYTNKHTLFYPGALYPLLLQFHKLSFTL